jgi:segregation and condensation protein B
MREKLETGNTHQPIIEALLFASEKPLSAERIQAVIKDISPEDIKQVIDILNQKYQTSGHSFAIKRVAKGYRMYTLPDYAPWIKALFSHTRRERLSPQALEVLSIIAYKQPIVRSEIDRLRGVNSDGPLSTLLDRKLITIVGRKPTPGRPLLYGTTQEFLTHFGLNDVDDLPKMEELEKLLKSKETPSFAEEIFDKLTQKKEEEASEEAEAGIPLQIPPEPPPQAFPEDETQ